MTPRPIPQTHYIDNGSGSRIIIAEHPTSVFIAMDRPAGFFTPDEAMEVAGELLAIARRLRKVKRAVTPS